MGYTLFYPFFFLFYLYVFWFRSPSRPHRPPTFTHISPQQLTHACTHEKKGVAVYHWGKFSKPILIPNIVPTGNGVIDLRLKRHHYLSVTTRRSLTNPSKHIALGVESLGYATRVFCYVFFPEQVPSYRIAKFRLLRPLTYGIKRFSDSSVIGVTEWRNGRNFIKIVATHAEFIVDVDVTSEHMSLHGNFRITKDPESISLLYPIETDPISRPAYTHTAGAMRTTGTFWCNDYEIDLDGSLAFSDWTVSIARRESNWTWANFSTSVVLHDQIFDVGVNLSMGLYEDAQNVIFVNGQVRAVACVEIEQIGTKDFSVKSKDAHVNITFTRISTRKEKANFGIVKNSSTQFWGVYTGSIQAEIGGKLFLFPLLNCVGVLEFQNALW